MIVEAELIHSFRSIPTQSWQLLVIKRLQLSIRFASTSVNTVCHDLNLLQGKEYMEDFASLLEDAAPEIVVDETGSEVVSISLVHIPLMCLYSG